MLIEFVISFVLQVVGGLVMIALAPLNALGLTNISGGVILGYNWLNTFLPVTETVAGIVFLLSVYLLLFGFRVLREAWSLVPFIGGH